jgi:hypothetical protein
MGFITDETLSNLSMSGHLRGLSGSTGCGNPREVDRRLGRYDATNPMLKCGGPRARIHQRSPVAPDSGALFAHPHRRETAGARCPGCRPTLDAHNGDGNGDAGANQTEIPPIVDVSDDLTSQFALQGSPLPVSC